MLRSRQTNVEWFSEMELSVPPEDLLISQRSVHDFYSFVQNHVMVWMSPQSFILTSETAQAVRLDDPEIQHVLTNRDPIILTTHFKHQHGLIGVFILLHASDSCLRLSSFVFCKKQRTPS
jgi:hypothetical protein